MGSFQATRREVKYHLFQKKLCLKNWPPISLLKVNYKILTKTFAIRLQGGLDKVISTDQVGFIKRCLIGENIRRTANILYYCNINCKSAMKKLLTEYNGLSI